MNGIDEVRKERPLVHSITNYVAAQTTANGLLAIGASPVMADALEEVEEMAAHADALVLNIGTPSKKRLRAMVAAGIEANHQSIPVILDPVAVGATTFRTTWVEHLLQEVRIDVIRGNIGEIAALAHMKGTVRGVDTAIEHMEEATIMEAARHLQTTIVATGKVDIVTNGTDLAGCEYGTEMLPMITGAGCLLSAVIGAYTAVKKDPYAASIAATNMYNIVAEKAAVQAKGAGSFYTQFFDELSVITDEDVRAYKRIERSDR